MHRDSFLKVSTFFQSIDKLYDYNLSPHTQATSNPKPIFPSEIDQPSLWLIYGWMSRIGDVSFIIIKMAGVE